MNLLPISAEHDEIAPDYSKPLQLFSENAPVKICAPMVRYSKLAFRTLVRKYGCDLAFTPMIIANSFVKSLKARDSEFTTNSGDRPLIVQFAANNGRDLADAAEIVFPYADGVDLNCGCPQRWAMGEGYGACLINKTDLVADMVKQTQDRVGADPDFTVSVKIRIHQDPRKTVDLCKKMEKAGVSFITIHGRTVEQRNQPVNLDTVRLVCENISIPVVANGDIRNMDDVADVIHQTGVKGVMAARGMLQNPAMFDGYTETPLQCVQDWVDIALSVGTQFQCFQHHLISMFERITSRHEKRVFNSLSSTAAIVDYLSENYSI